MKNDSRVPVTVLTGFLGAGKTTLLNRILTEHHGWRIAVIENEFGEIGIDNELVVNAEEEVFEMNNGCICCTVRGDLIRILGNLMRRRDKFDYILIETTGLADPGPVAQTFFVDDEMKEQFRLDGIITVVDVKHVLLHIDQSSECQEQIAFADKIILNKTDLVDEAQLDILERKLKSMNTLAHMYRAQKAKVPIHEILNTGAFDLDAKLAIDADFLNEEFPFEWSGEWDLPAGTHEMICQQGPDPTMGLVMLAVEDRSEDGRKKLQHRAAMLFSSDGIPIRSGQDFEPGEHFHELHFAPSGSSRFHVRCNREGCYRLFTQHLPEEFQLELHVSGAAGIPVRTLEHAAGHTHDNTVTSVGISHPGELNSKKLNNWISRLLREQGPDIFRMKGILNIRGSKERFVFQGVHMLFEGEFDRPWKNEAEKRNELVFIGRNLNRGELTRCFLDCIE